MIKATQYHGWEALALVTDSVELIIPIEIGPRIISCRVGDGPNLFYTLDDQLGGKGEDVWCLRGGHRLWHAPEAMPRTYDQDNFPIQATEISELADGSGLLLEAPNRDIAGILKTIRIETVATNTFKVTHTLKNETLWPVECAPWALTVMPRGGYATIPLLPKGSHENELLPNAAWVPWAYTDLSLPLWQIHSQFIGIDTSQVQAAQKLGLTHYPGWSAYWQPAATFVKTAPIENGARYPDMGCVFEVFCNDAILELETLGPLRSLAPGETTELVEHWGLFEHLPKPIGDEVYAEQMKPVINAWLRNVGS